MEAMAIEAKRSLSVLVPATLWEALDKASPKYGDKARIVIEALEAHPEVREQLGNIREERDNR